MVRIHLPIIDHQPQVSNVLASRDNGLVLIHHWIGHVWHSQTGISAPFVINGRVMQIEQTHIRAVEYE